MIKIPLLLSLGACSLLGCGAEPTGPGLESRGVSDGIVLDGDFDDWSNSHALAAQGRHLYLTFSPETRAQAIQASDITTRIRIDADADPSTGRKMDYAIRPEAIARRPQGVDLLIELSPRNELGGIGIGSAVTRYGPDGQASESGHAQIGFSFLPTYASDRYEARIDRFAPGAAMLADTGRINIVIDQVDADGHPLWSTELDTVLAAPETDGRADAELPRKAANAVRVMSANVLFSSPLHEPEPFARMLRAVDPDVILYQEWFRSDREDVRRWLKTHAGADWSLHMPDEDAGVAIATALPIVARYDSVLPASGERRPARAAAALIDTPAGELLAISTHLKCCGRAGSEEDKTRIAQAAAINAFVREVRGRHPDAQVVIAGDFNLVGSRRPLDAMAAGLGRGGRDLVAAEPLALGDSSAVTWVDEKSRFSPGRLDWVLYDDSRAQLANAFLVDTRALGDASLSDMGLERGDARASDHLPVVIDLTAAN